MNENEIRALPNAQLIEVKEQLLKNRSENFMANEDRVRVERLEASVSALIAAFKAAEEEQEEEEKCKAEEEAEQMVPVSKVAEEEEFQSEEEKPAEEDEEEKKETDEKLEALEAAINQLSRYVASKGKQTPGTPEDEPAMTMVKLSKITNGPVGGEKMLKNGDKVNLFQTPAMKPGKIKASAGQAKGQAQSFTGAMSNDGQSVEQKAVDEVFGFAAARGVVPMHADSRIKVLRR